MKNKTRYYLFITSLVFIGLIIAVGLFVSIGFLFIEIFTISLFDLSFSIQFFLYAVVYLLIFPAIMVLIGNVYFKTNRKKTWGNWLKIPLNYNSVFTVIAVYQCAYAMIELLIYCTSISASGISERVIMLTLPFVLFILSKKIIKKLFGFAEIEGVCETGDEDKIDPKNFTIRQPVSSFVIYLVISIFFLLLYVAVLVGSVDGGEKLEYIWLSSFLYISPFILFGPFLIFLWYRWKLVIKGNEISFTSYFKRKKTFTFGDITRVKHGIRYTKIGTLNAIDAYHEKKKLLYVSDNCPGYTEFVQRLKDEGVKIEW